MVGFLLYFGPWIYIVQEIAFGALFTISDAFWVYFHDLRLIMGYWKEGGLHALISPSLPLLHIYDFEFGPLFPWVHHKPLGSLQMFLCAHHFSQKVLQNGHEFKRPERKKMVWKPNDLPFSTYKPTLTKRGIKFNIRLPYITYWWYLIFIRFWGSPTMSNWLLFISDEAYRKVFDGQIKPWLPGFWKRSKIYFPSFCYWTFILKW